MNETDITMLIIMGITAAIAVGSFSILTKYLFDRGLADPSTRKPDILAFYKAYMVHTKKQNGQIGNVFWVHSVSAGVFIATGVAYTIYRFILPRFF